MSDLEDRLAIQDLLSRYAHAIDDRDWPALEACFAPGARVLYGGTKPLEGPEATAAYCRAVVEPLDGTQHRVASALIEVDGVRARSRCHLAAEHWTAAGRYTVGGTYVDELARTADGWQITARELRVTWTEGDPSVLARRS